MRRTGWNQSKTQAGFHHPGGLPKRQQDFHIPTATAGGGKLKSLTEAHYLEAAQIRSSNWAKRNWQTHALPINRIESSICGSRTGWPFRFHS